MHIVVIGAGLLGVTTAWYLRTAGHDVTVIEAREDVALETSYANGGQISISHPEPWANPGAPSKIIRWLGRKDAPLLFRMPAEAARWRWGLAFLRECTPGRTARNTRAIANLAAYSGQMLRELRERFDISYQSLQRGVLHLYFTPSELNHGEQQARILKELGIHARMLTPQECVDVDASLAHIAPQLFGGMLGEDDESGDAHLFAEHLADMARKLGVEFVLGSTVKSFDVHEKHVRSLMLNDPQGRRGAMSGDAYVICAGVYSRQLAEQMNEHLPIYPVKGYSATIPIADESKASTVSLTDESRRIVCTRLGDQLRVAGTAELNGYNLELDPTRCKALIDWIKDVLPGSVDTQKSVFWAGLRPTTPSNLPLIGRSKLTNLYYNTGHGTLGWTMACGSAQALSDIIKNRTPKPDFPFLKNGF